MFNRKRYGFIFIWALIILMMLTACARPAVPLAFQHPTPVQALTESDKPKPSPISSSVTTPAPINNPEGSLIINSIPADGGDCILVIQGEYVMLIDTGNASAFDEIEATLNAYDISTIDILVITHAHNDHIGSVLDVFNNFEINQVYMNRKKENSEEYDAMMDAVVDYGLTLDFVTAGDHFTLGNAACDVLHPQDKIYKDPNNNSIVFMLTFGEKRFLFTGDALKKAENVMLEQGYDLSADFIKIGHHGVDDATTDAFLDAVNTSFALIPSKRNRSYLETKNKLIERNIDYYVTLSDAHMKLICDDGEITVTMYPRIDTE